MELSRLSTPSLPSMRDFADEGFDHADQCVCRHHHPLRQHDRHDDAGAEVVVISGAAAVDAPLTASLKRWATA